MQDINHDFLLQCNICFVLLYLENVEYKYKLTVRNMYYILLFYHFMGSLVYIYWSIQNNYKQYYINTILLKVENCLECVKHHVLVIQKLYHLDKQYSIVNVVLEFEKWTTLATMSSTPVKNLPALLLIISPPFPSDSYRSCFKKMNNSHYNVTFSVFYFM